LKALVQIKAQHQQMGTESISMLSHAYIELLEAELPLAKTHAERIVLYEKSLEARTEIERITQAHYKEGLGLLEDYFRAKADRIKAEINLHNARKMK